MNRIAAVAQVAACFVLLFCIGGSGQWDSDEAKAAEERRIKAEQENEERRIRDEQADKEERFKAYKEKEEIRIKAEQADRELRKTYIVDDRDGKKYKKVRIGKKTWMAENLNYQSMGACYNAGSCERYGSLYTWDAAMKACPAGTHLPSDEEWKTFEAFHNDGRKYSLIGESSVNIVKAIKNNGEFSIQRGGAKGYYLTDRQQELGRSDFWWSSSEGNQKGNAKDAWMRGISLCEPCDHMDSWDVRKVDKKTYGSVRCVQD